MGVTIDRAESAAGRLYRLISVHGNTLLYRPNSEFLYDYGSL